MGFSGLLVLLIDPFGIEMSLNSCRVGVTGLLIEPFGIEIEISCFPVFSLNFTFNRTFWN